MTEEQQQVFLEQAKIRMIEALEQVGVDPMIIYAYKRTGRLVTTENVTLLSPRELAEWNAASREYRQFHDRKN